ncbi:unnamed protein product, partial [Heterosigma akashiwo]
LAAHNGRRVCCCPGIAAGGVVVIGGMVTLPPHTPSSSPSSSAWCGCGEGGGSSKTTHPSHIVISRGTCTVPLLCFQVCCCDYNQPCIFSVPLSGLILSVVVAIKIIGNKPMWCGNLFKLRCRY